MRPSFIRTIVYRKRLKENNYEDAITLIRDFSTAITKHDPTSGYGETAESMQARAQMFLKDRGLDV